MPAVPSRGLRILRHEVIFRGRIVRLDRDTFRLKSDLHQTYTREQIVHPGAVVIVPMLDPKTVILLRQYRYAAREELWELPAGTLERGERPLLCAKRELEEETGYRALRWTFLSKFLPAPGISTEIMTLYRAEGLSPGRTHLDHDEWITTRKVPLKRALAMVRSGAIRDAKTIVGLLWVRHLSS